MPDNCVGKMAEEVKLYGATGSPFTNRVQIALKLKGVNYEFVEESENKSPELLKYNPVHKKIPVFLHNGNPIPESALIVEYIDEVWKGPPSILPEDPYDKATDRFWAKFIDDKLTVAVGNIFFGNGEAQEGVTEEAIGLLKTLENQLTGKKFFGGDNIGLVDIIANLIGYWLRILQEVTEIELVTKENFPRLTEWMDDFVSHDTVKECLPNRDFMVKILRARFGKA